MYITYKRYKQLYKVYERVKKHYGKSRYYKDYPRLLLYFDCGDRSYGFFGEGEIGINFAMCNSVRNAVCSLIHEYKHYLQSPKQTGFSYWDDPAEREANKVVAKLFM